MLMVRPKFDLLGGGGGAGDVAPMCWAEIHISFFPYHSAHGPVRWTPVSGSVGLFLPTGILSWGFLSIWAFNSLL